MATTLPLVKEMRAQRPPGRSPARPPLGSLAAAHRTLCRLEAHRLEVPGPPAAPAVPAAPAASAGVEVVATSAGLGQVL